MPVSVDNEKFSFETERVYTPAELTALIKLYANYRDVSERELLVEYVDYALDFIVNAQDKAYVLAIVTEIAELGRKKIICTPSWVPTLSQKALPPPPIAIKLSRC